MTAPLKTLVGCCVVIADSSHLVLNGAGGFLGNDQILIAAAMRSLVAAARWPCGCAHREYVVERKGVRGGERKDQENTKLSIYHTGINCEKSDRFGAGRAILRPWETLHAR